MRFWVCRVADWFAQMNNKMGGDMKKIQTVGRYFVEIWKAVGMDMEHVKFLYASDEINKRPEEYWTLVMDIARRYGWVLLESLIVRNSLLGPGDFAGFAKYESFS